MLRSLAAAGLLLRRVRSERAIVILIFLFVAATSFVFAAAPRLFNRVTDEALQHAVTVAPPAQRDITVRVATVLGGDRDPGVSGLRGYEDRLTAQIPGSVAALIGDRSLRLTTVRFVVPDPPILETHLSLRYQDGLTDATRLVAGRWPADRGLPLELVPLVLGSSGPDEGPAAEPAVFEVALPSAAATQIGVGVGDRLALALDKTDPLVRGSAYRIGPAQVEIVGIYDPLDPAAAYWAGDPSLADVTMRGVEEQQVVYATGYVAAEEYPSLAASRLPFTYEWRFRLDPQRLHAGLAPELQAAVRRLSGVGDLSVFGASSDVEVLTNLPGLLDRFATERSLSESVLSVAAIGPLCLAAAALAMIAILLARRRRATLALARGRGASGSLLLWTQLWEAILVAGAAALVGLVLAIVVIDARATPASPALALAVAGAAALLLVGASWPLARRPLGQLERDDAPLLRVSPRRIVLELTMVLLAVGALVLLRQRGISVGEAGAAVRVDPLLASVPVLSGLAAGILALRLYPLPIRGLGSLAARRRDFVPVLGLRMVGRRPAAANLPLLALLLTAAFGAFSSVIAASLERGQTVSSFATVGADYRIERVGTSLLAPSLDPASVPGVEAVAAGLIEPGSHLTTSARERGAILLEAIDPQAYQAVVGGSAADPAWPGVFLAEPPADSGTEAQPIPAILSTRLPFGSISPGDTFAMTVSGRPMTFRLIERRDTFAGIAGQSAFAVVPYTWVRAASGNAVPPPSALWVRGSGDAAEPLAAAVAAAPGSARLVSRYDAFAALHDAPLSAAVVTAFSLAVVIAAVYMAFTIVGALILSAARGTQDLAYLRTLGVTAGQALALTVMEHAPPALLALFPGVALGVGIAILCEPGLGLATFVGTTGSVPLFIDLPALAIMVAALLGVVALAVTIGTWLSRRARLVNALRVVED